MATRKVAPPLCAGGSRGSIHYLCYIIIIYILPQRRLRPRTRHNHCRRQRERIKHLPFNTHAHTHTHVYSLRSIEQASPCTCSMWCFVRRYIYIHIYIIVCTRGLWTGIIMIGDAYNNVHARTRFRGASIFQSQWNCNKNTPLLRHGDPRIPCDVPSK